MTAVCVLTEPLTIYFILAVRLSIYSDRNNASFNTKCTAVQAQIIGMSLRPIGLAVTVMIFLSLSVFLFDETLSFFIGFSVKTGNTGDFVFHISKNENGNQSRIVLGMVSEQRPTTTKDSPSSAFSRREIRLHEGALSAGELLIP